MIQQKIPFFREYISTHFENFTHELQNLRTFNEMRHKYLLSPHEASSNEVENNFKKQLPDCEKSSIFYFVLSHYIFSFTF